jgi:transketolase
VSNNLTANTLPCRKVFTNTLLELAKADKRIIALATDSRGSVTLDQFAKELPGQFVEVGIAEQDSVGIGAGLATCGKKAFVCGPACFLSARSLEQIKIDVAYSQTNVKIVGVSGGVSYGALGMSHHSLHDIAVMRAIPGMTVIIPCDASETKKLTEALVNFDGPTYIRMGRGAVPDVYPNDDLPFEIGKANVIVQGSDITLIATGEMVYPAMEASRHLLIKGIRARVIDMHTINPLDTDAIIQAAKGTGHIVTIEEHSINGGLGAAVSETVVQNCPVKMKILGIPDEMVVTGTSAEVFRYYGLTAEGIAQSAEELLK